MHLTRRASVTLAVAALTLLFALAGTAAAGGDKHGGYGERDSDRSQDHRGDRPGKDRDDDQPQDCKDGYWDEHGKCCKHPTSSTTSTTVSPTTSSTTSTPTSSTIPPTTSTTVEPTTTTSTTTTSTPPSSSTTTSTVAPTTSTVAPTTASPPKVEIGTPVVVTKSPPKTDQPELAYTGSNSRTAFLLGVLCLALGLMFLIVKRQYLHPTR